LSATPDLSFEEADMQHHQADTPEPQRREWPPAHRPARWGRRSTGALRRRSLIALGLIAATGALAGPASAAVPGLERVAASSASNSIDKGAIASCPSGKRVRGAGADITGGLGQVVLDDIIPNSPLTSVSVLAREDQDGTTSNWSVSAYAICANAVAGLERVTATTSGSASFQSANAQCPSGKRLLGMGADISGGAGQVALTGLLPNHLTSAASPAGTRATTFSNEDQDGVDANWSVRAYAICATPPAGLEVVASRSPVGSLTSSSAFASCPAGKVLLGSAGVIAGGFGQVVMDDLTPSSSLTGNSVVGMEDQDGSTTNWSVEADAICASA
jgi:hypothetical protein